MCLVHAHNCCLALPTFDRYVGANDLNLFKRTLERPTKEGEWEPMMDKDLPCLKYTSWRRTLPVSLDFQLQMPAFTNLTAGNCMPIYVNVSQDLLVALTPSLETLCRMARRSTRAFALAQMRQPRSSWTTILMMMTVQTG